MPYPKLSYKSSKSAGVINLPKAWKDIHPTIRMDLLQDWIHDLEQEYQRAEEQLAPKNAGVDTSEKRVHISDKNVQMAQPEQYPQIAINPEMVGYVAPQRKPLTDAEILHRVDTHVGGPSPSYPLDNSDWLNFARAIEAAHGIKE